ncbi:MAG: glycoside hydrolase family 38 C-terminal domain-containing protein [Clostridia bacterium]|nr:glycoside hydrolase family 38 C-terminal domain-containing protein [Clostridia bacterium]
MEVKKYLKYFRLVKDLGRMNWIKNKAITKIGAMEAEFMYDQEPIPFEERLTRPTKPISVGSVWCNEPYGCSWFHFKGKVPETAKGKHVALMINLSGEGCMFDKDGNPVVGLTNVHVLESLHLGRGKKIIEVAKSAEGGEEIDIWIEGGSNHQPTSWYQKAVFRQEDIIVIRDDMSDLFYDYAVLAMHRTNYKKTDPKYTRIKKVLHEAFKTAKSASTEAITKARQMIKEELRNGEDIPYYSYATGHAHLDLAWLWPIRETKRKACRTFVNQIRNIEKFDGYVFGASQPQQFQWMEENHPSLFARIKEAVDNGKIELQGGMWVECDTNLTSGESLIRQNLYGKKYWREKFGKEVNFCWLPDVFGFSGNLPQILKKSGMDYFLTTKLSWNEHNKFPYRSFIWEGIDGSDVLVHMPPEDNYNGFASPITNMIALNSYPEKNKFNVFSMLYGIGDGGGGPSAGHVEMMSRQNDVKGLPKMIMAPAQRVFEDLSKFRDQMDRLKGELYLEKHQGTYTTQSNNKKFNRHIEFKLHNVEYLSVAAAKYGCPYPAEALERIWKEVLLYQFHDIIPGSSIARVYEETTERYQKMLAELNELEAKALSCLADGKQATAINCTPFTQRELVKKEDSVYEAVVPPYGAAELVPYKNKGMMKATDDTLESDCLLIKFDTRGNIASMYSKTLNKEFCGDYLNKLNVYKDKRMFYDAWDIDFNYTKKRPHEFKLLDSSFKVDAGFAVRENIYKYNKSSITQKVILTEGKPTVDFVTTVDWQETHRMLRADFRPTVFAEEVTCEIQMGNLKRSTGNRTKKDKAQFEICAHKWIDMSEGGYGISVLSESKYGWRVKEGLISMNLLRSPMYPAKDADKGTHTIKYSLYPHAGDYCDADTVKLSYSLNNPLIICDKSVKLPSFATVDQSNIVVETVKAAESGQGVVVRLYESCGQETQAKMNLSESYQEAYETDMLENIIDKVTPDALKFVPFEIKTLLFKK